MNDNLDNLQVLFGHVDQASAYVVNDYPYGFRLRCTMRYWIETNKKGDRLWSQTTDPKVEGEVWNKAKCSTYRDVGVMVRDQHDHISWIGLGSWPDAKLLDWFDRCCRSHLSDHQRRRLDLAIKIHKALALRQVARGATPTRTP